MVVCEKKSEVSGLLAGWRGKLVPLPGANSVPYPLLVNWVFWESSQDRRKDDARLRARLHQASASTL